MRAPVGRAPLEVMAAFRVSTVLLCVGFAVTADRFDCNAVYLTVSSLWRPSPHGRGYIDRDLELNWESSCDSSTLPDWMGLFDTNPSSDEEPTPLVKVHPADHPDGFYRTNISLGRPPLPGGWELGNNATPTQGDHCLPFWGASFKDGNLLHMDCLKIRPTWMWDHQKQLASLSLGALFIPGTHNSACYKGSLTRRDIVSRFLFTQDTSIWGQLVHGIRYLDVRVGYYPTLRNRSKEHNARFYVNHDMIRVAPLLPVLRELKKYLLQTKGEVVILDFHRFPVGFHGRAARHRRLVSLLTRELESFALPSSSVTASTLLRDIWEREDNRRLIVAYGNKTIAAESDWLWKPLPQKWGDEKTCSGLRKHLQNTIDNYKSHGPKLWAAMAQLTPTVWDLVKPSVSLRAMADAVNRNITYWFRNEWWSYCNIVATDFFLESSWLWKPLPQKWGDQRTCSGLRKYLQDTIDDTKSRAPALWAAMAELTPAPVDVMFNPAGSLRVMADAVNRNITHWFRNQWWSHCNIVATDFFLGNNIIDVAVSANLRKINMVES